MCCGSGKASSPRSNRSNARAGDGIIAPPICSLLGGIKKLLHDDGMTIKGVQKILREQGIKHVAGLSQPLDEVTELEAERNARCDVPQADRGRRKSRQQCSNFQAR